MKVGICGGGLQGVELCWLAQKAGWQTVLADRRPAPPASGLCDRFLLCDLRRLDEAAYAPCAEELLSCDLLIPALEDDETLTALVEWCRRHGKALAFDPEAYAVSSSKLRSRELFLSCGTPIPAPYDKEGRPCFPLCVKPSSGSGSRGVRLLNDDQELEAFLAAVGKEEWLVEAYCSGPSFSLEICGTPGRYRTFQVTGLFMDDVFDCRAVSAPSQALEPTVREMERELFRLAEELRLHGLMDLEVIESPDGMKVLEIDARFPSQTPTAVWLSTGQNLAEHLAACFIPYRPVPAFSTERCVLYEHVLSQDGRLSFHGEHIMSGLGPLRRLPGLFGTEEALVGRYGEDDETRWAATLMFCGADEAEVARKRTHCLQALAGRSWSDLFSDLS